jgi:hypothetical protein
MNSNYSTPLMIGFSLLIKTTCGVGFDLLPSLIFLASAILCLGVRDFIPSTPAVFLP